MRWWVGWRWPGIHVKHRWASFPTKITNSLTWLNQLDDKWNKVLVSYASNERRINSPERRQVPNSVCRYTRYECNGTRNDACYHNGIDLSNSGARHKSLSILNMRVQWPFICFGGVDNGPSLLLAFCPLLPLFCRFNAFTVCPVWVWRRSVAKLGWLEGRQIRWHDHSCRREVLVAFYVFDWKCSSYRRSH